MTIYKPICVIFILFFCNLGFAQIQPDSLQIDNVIPDQNIKDSAKSIIPNEENSDTNLVIEDSTLIKIITPIKKNSPTRQSSQSIFESKKPWFDSTFWDTNKVSNKIIENNIVKNKVLVDKNLIIKRSKTKNILFVLMAIIISILFIIIIQIYPNAHTLYSLSFLSRIRFRDILEEGFSLSMGLIIQVIIAILSFSLYLISISAYIPQNILPFSFIEIITYTLFILSLIYIADILVIFIYFYAFDKARIIKPFTMAQIAIDYAFSIILFPLSLVFYYNYTQFNLDKIWPLILLPLVIWIIVKISKSIYLIKSQRNSIDFYDILYFCTFKILPILILIKWLWV